MKKYYKQINSYKQGYDKRIFGGYIYQFGIWMSQYVWVRDEKYPYLMNTNTNEKFKGLNAINRELKFKELEIEPY